MKICIYIERDRQIDKAILFEKAINQFKYQKGDKR